MDQPGHADATRGLFDKVGVCGANVDYSASNTLLGDGTFLFAWNTAQDAHAAFSYTVNGKLRPIGSTGWTDAIRPKAAWVDDPPGSGNPAFIDALTCLGTNPSTNPPDPPLYPSNMPGPYGTLVAPGITTTSQSSFVIDVSNPQPGWATLPVGATSTPLVLATTSPSFALERMLLINVASVPNGADPIHADGGHDRRTQ